GDDARRSNLFDVHGYQAVGPGEAYDLRSAFFGRLAADLRAAAEAFDCAAERAEGDAATELLLSAKAARLLASVWTTIRNWLEWGALRRDGLEGAPDIGDPRSIQDTDAFRRLLFGTLRAELDNTLEFQTLLGDDRERVVARGSRPEDEDTFTLSPDLQGQ